MPMLPAALEEAERKQVIDRLRSAMTAVVCDTVKKELGPRAPGATERKVSDVAAHLVRNLAAQAVPRAARAARRHAAAPGVHGTAQARAVALMKQIFELQRGPGGTPSYILSVAQFAEPKKCEAICYQVCCFLASMLQDDARVSSAIQRQETPALSAADRERVIAKLRCALRQLVCDALVEEAARNHPGYPAALDVAAAKMRAVHGLAGLQMYRELSALHHDAEMCPTSYRLGDRGACDLAAMLIMDECPDGTWTAASCWSLVAHAVPFETCQRVCGELCGHLTCMLADGQAMAQLVAAEGHPEAPRGDATVRAS